MIPSNYKPKNFGKEYVYIKNSDQYPMFLAVALGIKKSFDDWIEVSKYDTFVEICEKHGLFVEHDVVFSNVDNNKLEIIGGKNITTTFRSGQIFNKTIKEGQVHVIISKDKNIAIESKKFSWYSVVINNRTINKPFVDHLRFGLLLGFPDCCVDFFKKYNNWNIYNHPYETLKNTKKITGKAIGSYYCNNFLMDRTFFLIHNLPCSYRCEKTISFAKKLEEEIFKVEPEFMEITKKLLKMPLLVFGEKNFIIFDGCLKYEHGNQVLEYKDAEYLPNYARAEENINFFDDIKNSEKIIITADKIIICKNDGNIKTINKKKEWFAIDFD